MGILENVKNMAAKAVGLPPDSNLSSIGHGAFHLLQQHGGIDGIKAKFEQQGLSKTLQSWISTGPNLPVSAEQIQKVFGNETLKDIAAKAGIPADQIGQKLAEYLPKIINKLSPNGTAPTGNINLPQVISAAASSLKPETKKES
jgi:uncharacterized protein YidB (DUF937 family)